MAAYRNVTAKKCIHFDSIDLLAILRKSLDRALFLDIFIHEVRSSGVRTSIRIDDYAKDGGEELFTKMHCVRITNP